MTAPIYMGDTASTDPAPPEYELTAWAGYVSGYVTYPTLVANHPGGHVLSITPNIYNRADGLDVETGDAVASQAGPWVRQMREDGIYRPCVYAQASRMDEIRGSINATGLARADYRLWVADWNGAHEVPAGYDALQFYGTVSGSWDYSVILPDFFAPAPSKPKPSMKYEWYVFKGERIAAQEYDKWYEKRKHLTAQHRSWFNMRRRQCAWYAARLERDARKNEKHGELYWDQRWHQGWRHKQLAIRAAGKQAMPVVA
jgi:hypothetical protein